MILCLWPQTRVQEKMSLLLCKRDTAQGLFFLLSLGGSKDRLHPPQHRQCLTVFWGSVLCPQLGVKPNTLKMQHFLYETLNSLSPWCYSLATCLVCEWILWVKAWHRLEAGLLYWELLTAPFWWMFRCGWLGSSLKISSSVSSVSPGRGGGWGDGGVGGVELGGMHSLRCILSHCYFWLYTVHCSTVTEPGCLVSA